MTMNIIQKSNEVIFSRTRRLPFVERKIVEEQVEQWIHKGIVTPCTSEDDSLVVIVKKKDGSSGYKHTTYKQVNNIHYR